MRWDLLLIFWLILIYWSQVQHINGSVQDCSNSIANALELLQSCRYAGDILTDFKYWSLVQHINGSVQDCSNSIAYALELLQSCTKPLIYASTNCVTGSGNGLMSNRHLAITRTDADLLSTGPLGVNCSLNHIRRFVFCKYEFHCQWNFHHFVQWQELYSCLYKHYNST